MSRRRNRKSLLPRLPKRLAAWLSVPELFGLGPGHIQMARELGMSLRELKAFSKLSPEHTWGLTLDEYIERRYRKKFSKDPPRGPRPAETQLINEWETRLRRRERKRQKSLRKG